MFRIVLRMILVAMAIAPTTRSVIYAPQKGVLGDELGGYCYGTDTKACPPRVLPNCPGGDCANNACANNITKTDVSADDYAWFSNTLFGLSGTSVDDEYLCYFEKNCVCVPYPFMPGKYCATEGDGVANSFVYKIPEFPAGDICGEGYALLSDKYRTIASLNGLRSM